jgi:hypothetical protein
VSAGVAARGIQVREHQRHDGTVTETFTVRWFEPDGTRPRRTFDSLEDALDFQAKRRAAKRWRPDELRQERAGRQPSVGSGLRREDARHDRRDVHFGTRASGWSAASCRASTWALT